MRSVLTLKPYQLFACRTLFVYEQEGIELVCARGGYAEEEGGRNSPIGVHARRSTISYPSFRYNDLLEFPPFNVIDIPLNPHIFSDMRRRSEEFQIVLDALFKTGECPSVRSVISRAVPSNSDIVPNSML